MNQSLAKPKQVEKPEETKKSESRLIFIPPFLLPKPDLTPFDSSYKLKPFKSDILIIQTLEGAIKAREQVCVYGMTEA